MPIFLASFDFKSSAHDYSILYNSLGKMDAHQAQTTAWLINSAGDVKYITQKLLKLIDKIDSLFVIEISPKTRWTATHLEHETGEWLKHVRP